MTDLLKPTTGLLCKLASIAVHADEWLSPDGHQFDKDALLAGLADPDVRKWLAAMAAASLAPTKRTPEPKP